MNRDFDVYDCWRDLRVSRCLIAIVATVVCDSEPATW